MRCLCSVIFIVLASIGPLAQAQDNHGFRLIGRALPGEANAAYVVGNRCFLAAGNSLQVFDVSNSAAPSLMGWFPLDGIAEDVFVGDNIAYVAAGAGGLVTLDVSSPSQISRIGHLPFADEAFGVAVAGGYAYVAGLSGGFVVVDISNPNTPTQIGSFAVEWAALNVDVRDSVAAVACGYGGLYILDISNPANPIQLGLVDTQDTWAYDARINGNYVYMAYALASEGGGLKVIDISTPSVPEVRGNLFLSSTLRRLDRNGSFVIAAADDDGMLVIDAASPSSPRVVGGWQHGYGKNSAYANDKIYLMGGQEGFRIFNASDVRFPQLASTYPTYSASQDVALAGSYAYVVEQPSGLKAVDLTNPAIPQVTFSRQFVYENGAYRGVSSGVSAANGRLFVSNFADLEGGRHDFRAFGLANPARPESLGIFGPLDIGVRGHRVRGDIAYLSNSGALKVVDTRNPDNMQFVTTVEGNWDFAYGLDLAGNYMYLGTMETGLRILDITNESLPSLVGSFDTNGQTFTAKYHNGHAYLPDYDGGLRIVNVENPAAPYEVGYFTAYQHCVDVAFIDNRSGAYAIAAFDDEIVALNIDDPANPIEVGYYNTGDPRRLSTHGDSIFVADRITGLYIFVLDPIVGVEEDGGSEYPQNFASIQNYPNPFNPSTTIEFVMPGDGWARIDVFDIQGRSIAKLFDGRAHGGMNRVVWDGRDSHLRQMPSGIYFYKLTTVDGPIAGRMTLMK